MGLKPGSCMHEGIFLSCSLNLVARRERDVPVKGWVENYHQMQKGE